MNYLSIETISKETVGANNKINIEYNPTCIGNDTSIHNKTFRKHIGIVKKQRTVLLITNSKLQQNKMKNITEKNLSTVAWSEIILSVEKTLSKSNKEQSLPFTTTTLAHNWKLPRTLNARAFLGCSNNGRVLAALLLVICLLGEYNLRISIVIPAYLCIIGVSLYVLISVK